jgi:hypothetical protein
MSSATQSRPRVKPPRSVRLAVPPLGELPAVITITVGKADPVYYFLRGLPSDYGEAFRLEKFSHQGGEVYDVNLCPDGDHCDCKGHLRWGTSCKHIGALRTLKEAGKL